MSWTLAALLVLQIGCGSTSPPAPTGSLYVSVGIRGVSDAATDTDGVNIVVDNRPPHHAIAYGDSLTISGLLVGLHSVAVTDVEPNCVLGGPNPQTATVYADSVTVVIVSGVCS